MKGGKPFILNPQGWLCRPEERLVSRFLADFLPVCRRPYKKIRTTCKTVASVLHEEGYQKYFFDTLKPPGGISAPRRFCCRQHLIHFSAAAVNMYVKVFIFIYCDIH